jgi:ribosomal protein L37AE/L43A
MTLQCPECRKMAVNKQSPRCESCGYKFTGTEGRSQSIFTQYLSAAIAIGVVVGVVLGLRR